MSDGQLEKKPIETKQYSSKFGPKHPLTRKMLCSILEPGKQIPEPHQPSKALEYYRKVGEYEESFYTHNNFARTYVQLKDYSSASSHLELMKAWLPVHQDYISGIEAQLFKEPCRPQTKRN
ncbi:MAG: hypothetical protein HQM08_20240 [Candidatus Riflebacteria bacterium]|nr:hypothetical protein [Candidatus Riflebacteria bacterium]